MASLTGMQCVGAIPGAASAGDNFAALKQRQLRAGNRRTQRIGDTAMHLGCKGK